MSYLKQQDLLDHAKNPKNYGIDASSSFISEQYNPSCGDSVVMCGTIESGETLIQAGFEGKGCVLSMAMASKLTEFVKGKSLEEIMLLNEDTVEFLLGMKLGPNRIMCGMLSVTALIEGIKKYQNR